MECAKDEIFNVKYNNEGIIKRKRTRGIIYAIKNNKIIQLIIVITLILSVVNIIFVYNFFYLLLKM